MNSITASRWTSGEAVSFNPVYIRTYNSWSGAGSSPSRMKLPAEPAACLEPRDPRRRRDGECSRSALFDLDEFGLFDAFAHDSQSRGRTAPRSSPAARHERMMEQAGTLER
jgi:hypothetical protein